jgi:hypothetical protein
MKTIPVSGAAGRMFIRVVKPECKPIPEQKIGFRNVV